jgi:hypothetical protein
VTTLESNDAPGAPEAGTDRPPLGPGFELKFLVEHGLAADIEAWGRAHMALDPHGTTELAGAYHTTSLYLDTPRLDVYHRVRWFKRRKFRVRRYGTEACVFLERKTRRGDRVAKRRTSVPDGELPWLGRTQAEPSWAGHWFQRRLQLRGLAPACRVGYRRTALVADWGGSPQRLTFDRDLAGVPATSWSVAPLEKGLPLLVERVIVEMKFQGAMPRPFKDLVAASRLDPCRVSKYRLCVDAWTEANLQGAVAHA